MSMNVQLWFYLTPQPLAIGPSLWAWAKISKNKWIIKSRVLQKHKTGELLV